MSGTDINELAKRIAQDRSSGASELARAALAGLRDLAHSATIESGDALQLLLTQHAQRLAALRPSMAPLQNLLRRFAQELVGLPQAPAAAVARASAFAEALIEDSRRSTVEAAAQAARLIRGRRIITHSLSSTVREAFRLAASETLHVTLSEARPLYEGRALAEALAAHGIAATYITDAQLGLAAKEAELALVGADALLRDGSVVNKAGTYLLALACHDQGIPFYVCCERLKRLDAQQVELETMDPAELDVPGWPGVRIVNRYFDVTPARLVSGWIDEAGCFDTF